MTGRHAGPPLGDQARDATAPPWAGKHRAPERRCPSTHEHQVTYMPRWVGVQCKYTEGHDGRHCGYTGYNDGDVFWDSPSAAARYHGAPEDEDRCGSCGHPWQDECGCSCCPVPDPADHQEAPDGPR